MNHVALMGRLGRDPEGKTIPSGKNLAKFSVAVREIADKVTWFDVVCWEKTADAAMRLKKGDMVGLEGRMQREDYEKDGVKKTHWSMVATRLHYTGGNKRDDAGEPVERASAGASPAFDDVPFMRRGDLA